ncbi:MAG: exo-alpha-sialidase, partial [Bacteroidaceae bacterium]|nr:exo-alpha-sialidase [Bacteroidaceae bacterium]
EQLQLRVKAEVDGLDINNPNTHFGMIRTTSKFGTNTVQLMRDADVATIGYLDTPTSVIEFTRAYRGFEFQGFFLNGQDLGKSVTLTDEQKALITEGNPLVAKFTPTADVTLFYDDDEFSYRIPAIGKTSTGRLIAVSDYRHSLDDIGRYNFGTANPGIDLVIRTSDDNGKTWSAKQTIAAGSCKRGTDDCAYGDAAIAVVGQKVLVMAAAGDVMFGNGSATAHNRAVRVFSEDNGATWTKQDISETLFLGEDATIKNGYSSFFGSGRLAVDENYNGTGKARIYGALLLKKASGTGNYVIYTDDLGLTWNILGGSQEPIANQDEPKVEILPSGQILLSVRRGGGRQFNVFTYTDKGTNAGSWDSNVNGCSNGGSNTCNGEPYLVDAVNANGDPVKLLLQSQPKGGSGLYDRRDVTIWYKEITNDNYTSAQIAGNWTQGIQVSTQQSAYSAMTLQDDGKIAFFFEEAPCYGDDQAKGYCMVYTPLTIEAITNNNYTTPEAAEGGEEVTSADALPGDGTLRFYRLAIPVTKSAFDTDLGGSYDRVLAFWQECEDFVNKMFVPLGFCFDVVMDERLSNVVDLPVNAYNGLPEIGNCTYDLNNIIGETNYDVAMWVTHRDDFEENSGLSALKGAYSSTTKGSGYAKTDKWVVAHELGHMFGAVHTLQGEGSLMDNLGEFFSYPSIKAIRNSAKGTVSYRNVTVANNAPQFDAEQMKTTYRIPQGACLAIDVQATDIEKHQLMYTAIGCNSKNVDNVQEGVNMTLPFASFAPQRSNVISYAPIYTADLFYDDYFYLKEGTDIHEMEPGTYPLSILVNDVSNVAWNYAALTAAPFYSTYAIWESNVEIVPGEAFTASLQPAETEYTAGEEVTVQWGVNKNYFTKDSRLRISMSSDYGKTFTYVLAEDVKALDGSCTVTLPNVNVGQVDVDFTTAVRRMNGGVIKIEEVGGPAFTLTVLDPNDNESFIVTGGTDEPETIISSIGAYEIGTFYANRPVEIPEGVKAYVATTLPTMDGKDPEGNAIGTITLTQLEEVIPAQTGAVIKGKENTYTFFATTSGSVITDNLLRGYAGTEAYAEVALPTDGSTNYVLTVMDGVAGFYRKVAGFKVYNNKAYLNVPTNAKALRMRFVDADGTTEIHDVMIEQSADNCIYDLTGRRVRYAGKGVYIVNGKKVMR